MYPSANDATSMPEARLLFAYGTLGPGGVSCPGEGAWEPDAVRGRLYDLGPYPGLVDLDDPSAGWVEGHTRPVTLTELVERLDPYEGVASGLYRREATRTRAGRMVWVYVYQRPLPAGTSGPMARWVRRAGK